MKIGVLGTGNLGRVLGSLWAEVGHEVLFASSQPEKATASYPEVVESCEVLLFTARQAVPSQLAPVWRGRTVIDCRLEELGPTFEFAPRSRSLAEDLAEQIPMCQVVKAFCLHPMELYQHGPEKLGAWGVQSFYCGDLPQAREQVGELIRSCGLLPFDCGGLKRARLLEAQGNFWRIFQLQQGVGLVSQFQLVGYPEPESYPYGRRQASYLGSPDADDPTLLPSQDPWAEAPPE